MIETIIFWIEKKFQSKNFLNTKQNKENLVFSSENIIFSVKYRSDYEMMNRIMRRNKN